MRKTIDKLLTQYGRTVLIDNGGQTMIAKAVLQQSYFKSQYNMEKTASPMGVYPKSQYVYIGPLVPEIAAGGYITAEGKRYFVRQVQTVWYGEEPLYLWGMCVEAGE